MSDLIDDPRLGENAPEFTVSEISGAVKRTLEAEFGRIRVKGEVGRVVQARSGHMYFDVIDERNALACTTWKGQVSKLSVLPEEGKRNVQQLENLRVGAIILSIIAMVLVAEFISGWLRSAVNRAK